MAITLKAARVNAGLTQDEVAEKLGIAITTLVRYEQGKTLPDAKMMTKLASLYEFPQEEIIFFKQ